MKQPTPRSGRVSALIVILLVVAAAALATGGWLTGRTLNQFQSAQPIASDSSTPTYEFTALDGRVLTPTTLAGKVVFIDIWATWCGPCRKTIPHLESLSKAFPEDVVVVGVSSEPAATVTKFLASNPVSYPMVAPAPRMARPFSAVQTIPTIFVLRRDGTLSTVLVGSHDVEQLIAAFRSADSPVVP